MQKIIRLSLLCLPVLLISCAKFKEPEFRGLGDVEVKKLAMGGTSLVAQLQFFNPNKSGAVVKSAEGKIWMDNKYLGQFNLDTSLSISGKADFSVPVSMEVDIKTLLKNTLFALLNDSVTFRIEGNARAGRSGIYRNFPITYVGKQNIQDLLEKQKF